MDWLLNLLGVTDLHFWTSPSWWAALAGIIWVDILLSGDNALVIGMVAAELPPRQRRYAVLLGTAAAILLRVLCSLVMTQLLLLPWIGIVGALVLVYIAVKLVLDHEGRELRPAASLGKAVFMIVMADITMSIDNMMAIAGLAHGDATLVGIGLLVSIALIIAGATLISGIIARYPWLTWVGAGFLGFIAGGIAEGDPAVRAWTASQGWLEAYGARMVHYGASAAGAVLVLTLAWLLSALAGLRAREKADLELKVRDFAEASSAAMDREDVERREEITDVVRSVISELGLTSQRGENPADAGRTLGPLVRPSLEFWIERRIVPILPPRFADNYRLQIASTLLRQVSGYPMTRPQTFEVRIDEVRELTDTELSDPSVRLTQSTVVRLLAQPWFKDANGLVPTFWYVREADLVSYEFVQAWERDRAWPARGTRTAAAADAKSAE